MVDPSPQSQPGARQQRKEKVKPKLQPANILVMGPTGAGKTSFINVASGSQLEVGRGLQSSTQRIQMSQPFQVDKYLVALVDTPGFDDTVKSNAETLRILADYLSSEYRSRRRLHGIIYIHRISDNRMGGGAMRNFDFFQKLCGKQGLKSAAIVTTMWSLVKPEVGNEREIQLKTGDKFFKPALDGGAQLCRYDGTPDSAKKILRGILRRGPKSLLIQYELVDEGKHLSDTAAGIGLLAELAIEEQNYRKQLEGISREIKEAIERKDREEQEALVKSQSKVLSDQDTVRRERENFTSSKKEDKPAAKSPWSSLLKRVLWIPSYLFPRFRKRRKDN